MNTAFVKTVAVCGLTLMLCAAGDAAIPTCSIHNGMRVWFLDYAESDTTFSNPLGVGSGIVEINEREWHRKCGADGPGAKIYVPFNADKGLEKGQWDTRWPQDIYKTRATAESALHH